jgi:ankyrin repeat protein
VALQLDVLLNCPSVASIKRVLEMLPRTLDNFYDRALQDISEPHQRFAAVALQWLAFSARPLSLSELAEAIVIRPEEDPSFNHDERLMDEFQIVEFLPAGLVRKVYRRQPWTDGRWLSRSEEVAFIEFAHFSVLEYLKSGRMDPKLRATYQVQEQAAHTMIAASCFSYMLYVGKQEQALVAEMSKLLNDNLGSQSESIIDKEYRDNWKALCQQLDEHYVLSAYANRAWQYHISRLEADTSMFSLESFLRNLSTQPSNAVPFFPENIEKLSVNFLDVTGNSWIVWCCCFNVNERDIPHYSEGSLVPYVFNLGPPLIAERREKIHPVTWVSYLGLSKVLTLLLRENFPVLSVVERTFVLGSPLHAASYGNNLQTVKLLVLMDADLNERGGRGRTPLRAACSNGSLEMVRLLVEVGADVNHTIEYDGFGTALGTSCYCGHLEIVQFLIDSGADVNALPHSSYYVTALSAACYGASKKVLDIARLLIDSGADLDVTWGDGYGSPLTAACTRGSQGLVRLLLESGANVKGDTAALEMAICHCEISDIILLLEYGASIGSKEDSESPYQTAMKNYRKTCDNNLGKATKYKTILDIFDSHLAERADKTSKSSPADPFLTVSHTEVMEATAREEGTASLPLRESKD